MERRDKAVFFISLIVNIILSFFLGVKYKTDLIKILTETIYYQLIVFISLLMPTLINSAYGRYRLWSFHRRKNKLRSIDAATLSSSTRKQLEELVNTDIKSESEIKDLYDELQDLKK